MVNCAEQFSESSPSDCQALLRDKSTYTQTFFSVDLYGTKSRRVKIVLAIREVELDQGDVKPELCPGLLLVWRSEGDVFPRTRAGHEARGQFQRYATLRALREVCADQSDSAALTTRK
jgi:hypothetical protein